MDFRQSIEIRKKSALVVFITGIIANTVGSISNVLLYGIGFMSIVSLASIVALTLFGGIGLGTKRYLFCVYSILAVIAGVEFPVTVFYTGAWRVIYFLIPIIVADIVSTKRGRRIIFAWCVLVGLISGWGYYFWTCKIKVSDFFGDYMATAISYVITATAITVMCSIIVDTLNKYTAENVIANTIYKGLEKVTTLNLDTGIYEYIKKSDQEFDRLEIQDFRELSRVCVEVGIIHPSDEDNWRSITNLEYVKNKLKESGRYTSMAVRMKHHKAYGWYEYEYIARDDFSEKNPICVCYIRKLDNSDYAIEDSMRLLTSTFHKILRINLTNDSYETVKYYKEEASLDKGFSHSSISKWMIDFANSGMVHSDDKASYLEFINLDRLRISFKNSDIPQRLKYRRMTHGEWKWVAMELVRSIDYVEDSEIILLYIRDIDDEYTSEVQHTKLMEYYCNYDSLCNIYNRFRFNTVCDEYAAISEHFSLGVLFCDLNRLKITNDTEGHAAGDNLIKRFSELMVKEFGDENCYRISGDEFVVLLRGVTDRQFANWAEEFKKVVVEQNDFIASVGMAFSENTDKIESLVRIAEKDMYKHKQFFYDSHPQYDRRV